MALTVIKRLLKLHGIVPAIAKAQADPSFQVVSPLRLQIAAALGAAHVVVEVRVRRMTHGTVGRRKQNGRTVSCQVQRKLRTRHKARPKHRVQVPCRRRRQRKPTPLCTVSHCHVGVQTNVTQLVQRLHVFVAKAVHAKHVALDEFATDVGRHKGLAQRRGIARHKPSTGGVADVVVGGTVPSGCRVHPKHQESVVCLDVIVLVFTVELELVDVGAVVQGRFNGEVIPRLVVDRLALDGLGFLVLVREGRGVEVLRSKVLARIPQARPQRPPVTGQPAGITGAQNGGIRVGA